ncbi:MAG TPA: Na+:solute symporter [Thermoguttaceae bacterium]|nr:Na+:solute symporter [Thermoguttaceae bacterium]
MKPLDYAVLIGFMAWMLVIGALFSRRMKNASEMFAAGGRSPWWISGLSGFMTIFSAGTFVVWGGIAYRLGLVAVSILMATGMSTILVGWSIAGRWRRMGITTPTEFLRIRFNEPVVQVYTWLGMLYRGLGLGVALYSLAVMLAVLVPLPEGAPFRDAQTGNLSVNGGIILWGAVVIIYTVAGGLWAVLLTDVIQCLILCLVVLVAVPLSLATIGGPAGLWNGAPEGFFLPARAEYTYSFLFFWFWLGFFRYAADWGFVQRYICVPTPRDARKAAFLMGGLYVISPIFWMLPAMAYRVLNPEADAEEAYMLICRKVLPAGMLGIMVAAMFSATASTVSAVLNVFAGVFTCDVYKAHLDPGASQTRLVLVGRLATLVYGMFVMVIAMSVPYVGGAENLVLVLVTSLLGPLMLPIVWGLYSRHVGPGAVWAVLGICTPVGVLVKFGPGMLKWLGTAVVPGPLAEAIGWVQANPRVTDTFLGLLLPLGILLAAEALARVRGVDAGWGRMQTAFTNYAECATVVVASRLPTRIVAISLVMLGLLMTAITILAAEQKATLAVFAAMLLAAAGVMGYFGFRRGNAK